MNRILPNPAALAVLLVAGDSEQPVFDNAIRYFHDMLIPAGIPETRIHILSVKAGGAIDAATPKNIQTHLANLAPPPGGGCLVYMTSHGVYGEGLYLQLSDSALTPEMLDTALTKGCGTAPTVVIISSCFSGRFAAAPVTRDNRIVLTASDADHSSFGCGADYTYTFFDDCLLGALDGSDTWREIFGRTASCVGQREEQSGIQQPSHPQGVFGAAVAGLASPWATPGLPDGSIQFRSGSRPFSIAEVPLSGPDRNLMQDELTYYAAAPGPKALALAPIGFATATARDIAGQRSADDVARIALQRCEWVTGGGCILYARDSRVTRLLPSGLPPFHPQILVRDGTLTSSKVPFIRDDQRQDVEDYLGLKGPKALALSPSHDQISVGTGATLDVAKQEALARCQFVMENCILYAENDNIVLGW